MALTNIQVAQQACIEVGLSPVQTMTDTTAEGKLIEAMYDLIVADALSRYTWRFACAQEELSLLSATPEGRWTYAFQLPSTVLTIKAITTVDQPIEFDRYDDMIYCDADGTTPVILDGVFTVIESKWPPYFTRYVVLKLAAVLASGVREDAAMSQLKEQLADIQYRAARNVDAQGRTASALRPTRITNARIRRAGL